MVIDTSAIVAIVLGEDDGEIYLDKLRRSADPRMSAANVIEAAMVVEARHGPEAGRDLQLLLDSAKVEVEPVRPEHVHAAIAAWRRFGKGRHPAQLNLGDCFAYALARTMGEPLLFKGDDFGQTDVIAALP
jgi:ribonuclease VapC